MTKTINKNLKAALIAAFALTLFVLVNYSVCQKAIADDGNSANEKNQTELYGNNKIITIYHEGERGGSYTFDDEEMQNKFKLSKYEYVALGKDWTDAIRCKRDAEYRFEYKHYQTRGGFDFSYKLIDPYYEVKDNDFTIRYKTDNDWWDWDGERYCFVFDNGAHITFTDKLDNVGYDHYTYTFTEDDIRNRGGDPSMTLQENILNGKMQFTLKEITFSDLW